VAGVTDSRSRKAICAVARYAVGRASRHELDLAYIVAWDAAHDAEHDTAQEAAWGAAQPSTQQAVELVVAILDDERRAQIADIRRELSR
jgi:hypothetical protein